MKPFYVGHFTCRLDLRCRLRLPIRWRFDQSQSWLIVPNGLQGEAAIEFRDLRLIPIHERTAAHILETLKSPATRPPTIDAAIEALRVVARGRGIDPEVITQQKPDTRSIHIQLSDGQLEWLGARNRSLMLLGVFTNIQIWAAAEYARWQQHVSGPAFETAVRRTLRDS